MKTHDDSIPEIAHTAAISCMATFGASQLVLRYFTERVFEKIGLLVKKLTIFQF